MTTRLAGYAALVGIGVVVGVGLLGVRPAAARDFAVAVGETNTFTPADVSAQAGDRVVWTWPSAETFHSVTADDGLFNSHPTCGQDTTTCGKPGETFTRTFGTPGTFRYYCVIHGGKNGSGMSGIVRVAAAPAQPAPSASATSRRAQPTQASVPTAAAPPAGSATTAPAVPTVAPPATSRSDVVPTPTVSLTRLSASPTSSAAPASIPSADVTVPTPTQQPATTQVVNIDTRAAVVPVATFLIGAALGGLVGAGLGGLYRLVRTSTLRAN